MSKPVAVTFDQDGQIMWWAKLDAALYHAKYAGGWVEMIPDEVGDEEE